MVTAQSQVYKYMLWRIVHTRNLVLNLNIEDQFYNKSTHEIALQFSLILSDGLSYYIIDLPIAVTHYKNYI